MDIEELLAEATPQEEALPLCLRGDLRAQWEELDRDFAAASRQAVSLGEPSPAKVIAQRMQELRGEIEAATVQFRLRAVPPRQWSAFRDTRPLKGDDQSDEDWENVWHGWICQVVALSCVDPVMTPEQADRLSAKLSNRQWVDLTNTAWRLNEERERVPFSAAASVLIAIDGEKSRRPEPPVSPSPDSSAASPAKSPRTRTTKPAARPGR